MEKKRSSVWWNYKGKRALALRICRNLGRIKILFLTGTMTLFPCPFSPLPMFCCQINLHKIQFSSFYSSDEKFPTVYQYLLNKNVFFLIYSLTFTRLPSLMNNHLSKIQESTSRSMSGVSPFP